jgi:threonine dehydratase
MNRPTENGFCKGARAATQALRDLFEPTPLMKSSHLGELYGADIWLKREDLTPVRSYKLRGAYNFFRKALERKPDMARFVCSSAGNHAQGFAYACRHFDVKGVIFMPVTTPQQKIERTRGFGGDNIEIRLVGDIFDESNRAAIQFARESGAKLVPPFDDADIIEGQATIGVEILAQARGAIDMLILPVGGGGLSAGVTRLFTQLSPQTEIIYVEPKGAPSLNKSLQASRRVRLRHVDGFVDGAAVAQIGALPFRHLKHVDPQNVLLADENSLCRTMTAMLNAEGVVLEPAGALSVEALRLLPEERLKGRNIVCLASGGNFDFERMAEVRERAMKAAGLKKYYIIRLPQRPGALRDFLELLGPDDDIARFEYLKKSARNFGSILLGVESSRSENFTRLEKRMGEAGIRYHDITDDELIAGFVI